MVRAHCSGQEKREQEDLHNDMDSCELQSRATKDIADAITFKKYGFILKFVCTHNYLLLLCLK